MSVDGSDCAYAFAQGEVDELRFYNGIASADWVAAEYATVANNSGFASYGVIEELEVVVVNSDGEWTSSAASGNWSDTANWKDGTIASGVDKTATFNSTGVSEQTVSLQGTPVALGAVVQQDTVTRTIADGNFVFQNAGDFTVVDGGSLSLASPYQLQGVVKKGGGSLAFGDAATLSADAVVSAGTLSFKGDLALTGDLEVNGGSVSIEGTAATPAVASVDESQPTQYFVADGSVLVTHLGVRASDFAPPVRVRLSSYTVTDGEEGPVTNATIVAETRFGEGAPGIVSGGFRYLLLPVPASLTSGMQYMLTSVDSSNMNTATCNALMCPQGESKSVDGALVLAANTSAVLAAPRVSLDAVSGSGTLLPGSGSTVLAIETAADTTSTLSAAFGAGGGGSFGLEKLGAGELRFGGTGLFPEGIYCKEGTVIAETAAALSPTAPIVFNDPTGGNRCGVFTVAADNAVVSNQIHVLKMTEVGLSGAGIAAYGGNTLTVQDTGVHSVAPDAAVANGKDGEFALHAFANPDGGDPTIFFRSNQVDYVDFVMRVDGIEGQLETRPDNRIVADNISMAPRKGTLRKFVVQNGARSSLGGTVEICGGNTVFTDYLDFTGSQLKAILTGGTTFVASNVRLADSTPSWETIDECNVDFTVDGGSTFVANGFPTDAGNLKNVTNTVLRLDGGTLKMRTSTNMAAPLDMLPVSSGGVKVEVTSNGATIDTVPYDGSGTIRLRVSSPIVSAEGATATPVLIKGGSSLSSFNINADMTYIGPTTVDGVTLQLTKSLRERSDICLLGNSKIYYTPDSDHLTQVYGKLTAADTHAATVNAADGNLVFVNVDGVDITKTGDGSLGIALGLSETASVSGTIHANAGSVWIGDVVLDSSFELVSEGGFDPSSGGIHSTNMGNNDKRSKRDASYLSSNFSSWTFDSSNNGSGICCGESYFADVGQIPVSEHCAFLFNKDGGFGRISRNFTVEAASDLYTLEYSVASRYYGSAYYAQVTVELDGEVVDTYPETPTQTYEWLTRRVRLGHLSPGAHTIAFTTKKDPASELDANSYGTLLDNVKMSVVRRHALDQLSGLSLDIAEGATLNLDGDFTGVELKSLTYNGQTIRGVVSRSLYPEFVTGEGKAHVPGAGMNMIIR